VKRRRRFAVQHARDQGLTERHACRLLGQWRTTQLSAPAVPRRGSAHAVDPRPGEPVRCQKPEAHRTSPEFQYPVPRWPCAEPVPRHSLGNLYPTFLSEPMPGCPNTFRAECEWLIAYDNLSSIPHWLSDPLCRLATGGGLSTRELYTDEVIFDAMRPVGALPERHYRNHLWQNR
jgi:hypothetical protein